MICCLPESYILIVLIFTLDIKKKYKYIYLLFMQSFKF